jgi:hypothetical protein
LEIELDSRRDAERRLNRIGAEFRYIPPNAPLEDLRRFDVLYFPRGWGGLSGLASLADVYRKYVEGGGGLLFAEPEVDGDSETQPALKLLPFPVTVSSRGAVGGQSVRAYPPGKPHVLLKDTEVSDLPYPYDAFTEVDPRWRVLAAAQSEPKQATLLAAEVGEGRILVHSDFDDYGHKHFLSDRFVVRMLKWLAKRPDEELQAWEESLGPRRYPEFVQQLQSDYESLIAKEPPAVRAALENAERILRHEAQQSSTWNSYHDALTLIRRHRSKASIPLLLRLLADEALSHNNYDNAVYQWFVLLTGRRVVGQTPEEVARRWWFPQRDEITIDLGEMNDRELAVILDELLKVVINNEPFGAVRDKPLSPSAVDAIMKGGYRFYASEHRALLDENLKPLLLKTASDRARRWLLVGPLAAMDRLRRIDLAALVRDRKAPEEQRVIAAAALHRAGETIPADVIVALLRDASQLDLQKALIWLLGQSNDPAAIETVVGCLSHPRAELHEIAALAVSVQQSPSAVEPLAERIRARHAAGQDVYQFAFALGQIQDPRTVPVLAQLLAETLKTARSDDDILGELVSAFERAVGKSFDDAGETDREAAKNALAWWRMQ